MSVPSAPSQPPKYRFSEVDGLRAVACALVIVSHTTRGGGAHRVLVDILEVGMLGVIMFFAISGFVIPDSLRGARWQGVKHFAIRRFWRLYPPFWGVLLLHWVLDPSYLPGARAWDAVMLPSLGMWGHGYWHFWTLEVELVFYLSVAALYFVFGRLGWRVLLPSFLLLVVLTVTALGLPKQVWNYDTMFPNLVVMFWGSLCREILRFDFSRWPNLTPRYGVDWARATALGLVSGITLSTLLMTTSATKGTGHSFELAGVLGILGFLFWVILKPVRIAWLSHIGRCTYSTYLMHMLVLITVIPLLGSLTVLPGLSISVALVFSFTVGALAYRWIEQPSDRIGKRITAS